jgi:hypothetical protein
MRFKVSRTSLWDRKNGPCAEAYKKDVEWRGKTFGLWFVDFNSLEELLEFISTHGAVVMDKTEIDTGFSIEIYDNYRE